ncbi:PA3496 family putative envelope integrity protein [Halomonas daqiaonensis]|uniref:Uncharacterized protein n=1 Tax=Halomonas daqiaonensis TaxID=650850 RepID=A0A1H7M5T4_9GAMM|nr:hypothetical protein [Halomonas daqiaonensis]SEL06095.1 hypothetical protein SAMN04488129_106133 [Halomonas daqiaonensis]
MSHEPLLDTNDDDDQDYLEAVNDDYGRVRPSSRADTLKARRRVEALIEERRLQRAIEDDWNLEEEE